MLHTLIGIFVAVDEYYCGKSSFLHDRFKKKPSLFHDLFIRWKFRKPICSREILVTNCQLGMFGKACLIDFVEY